MRKLLKGDVVADSKYPSNWDIYSTEQWSKPPPTPRKILWTFFCLRVFGLSLLLELVPKNRNKLPLADGSRGVNRSSRAGPGRALQVHSKKCSRSKKRPVLHGHKIQPMS